MESKGYDFPLFSLCLVPDGVNAPDDRRYAIPSASGPLMVRRPRACAEGACPRRPARTPSIPPCRACA